MRQAVAQDGTGRCTKAYERGRRQVLETEEHRQSHSARRGCQREEPCWCRGSLRNYTDCLSRRVWRKPTGAQPLDCLHHRNHAIHVHAGGVGRHLGDQSAARVLGLKL